MTDNAPIARVTITEDAPAQVTLYAPGLPPGEFDLYLEPLGVEATLREELQKYAFHKGEGVYSLIEYCNYCSYSRDWIAKHGHGETCLLKGDAK